MSLLNPGLLRPQAQRQAASLKTTLLWYARHGWTALEAAGRRRAAGELKRVGLRMKRNGQPGADEVLTSAKDCAQP
jgi:hypothetical protein